MSLLSTVIRQLNEADLANRTRVHEANGSPVTVRDVQPLVDKLNKILKTAQDISNKKEVKKKTFRWQKDMSDAEALKVLQKQDHALKIKDGPKYIKLDRHFVAGQQSHSGSGVFMVDKSDGRIYGIKGYGTPNKIPKHQYGTVAEPATKRMAIATAVLEKEEVMRMNIQEHLINEIFPPRNVVSEKDFDSLKKNDIVKIEYGSAMSSGTDTFKVTAKNIVGASKVGKITLKSVARPNSVKYFLYKRNKGQVTFAQGDMGAIVKKFTKVR
jgi:hypothetical protein